MSSDQKKFYVYEHIKADDNICFYVGKGCGNRAFQPKRNKHHDSVAKIHGLKIKIVKDNMTEKEAFDYQKYLIHDYVFNKGYGIDITGYHKSGNHYLINASWGGQGSTGLVHTKEWREKHSKDMSGKNNPMYGINVWDGYTEQKAKEVRKKLVMPPLERIIRCMEFLHLIE